MTAVSVPALATPVTEKIKVKQNSDYEMVPTYKR